VPSSTIVFVSKTIRTGNILAIPQRGHVLGGSSSTSESILLSQFFPLTHVRRRHDLHLKYPNTDPHLSVLISRKGSSDDFDRFASYTGDSGWTWKNMLPYFLKVGSNVPSLKEIPR
jgi:hypothetical protein